MKAGEPRLPAVSGQVVAVEDVWPQFGQCATQCAAPLERREERDSQSAEGRVAPHHNLLMKPRRYARGVAVEEMNLVAALREEGQPAAGVDAVRIGKERQPQPIPIPHARDDRSAGDWAPSRRSGAARVMVATFATPMSSQAPAFGSVPSLIDTTSTPSSPAALVVSIKEG